MQKSLALFTHRNSILEYAEASKIASIQISKPLAYKEWDESDDYVECFVSIGQKPDNVWAGETQRFDLLKSFEHKAQKLLGFRVVALSLDDVKQIARYDDMQKENQMSELVMAVDAAIPLSDIERDKPLLQQLDESIARVKILAEVDALLNQSVSAESCEKDHLATRNSAELSAEATLSQVAEEKNASNKRKIEKSSLPDAGLGSKEPLRYLEERIAGWSDTPPAFFHGARQSPSRISTPPAVTLPLLIDQLKAIFQSLNELSPEDQEAAKNFISMGMSGIQSTKSAQT